MDDDVLVSDMDQRLAIADPLALDPVTARTRRLELRPSLERDLVLVVDVFALLCASSANRVVPSLAAVFVVFAAIALNGTRSLSLAPSALADTPVLCARIGLAALVLAPLAFLSEYPAAFVVQVVFSTTAVLLGRAFAYAVARELRGRGRIARPATVVGEGAATTRIVELVAEHPSSGLVVGDVRPDLPSEVESSNVLIVVDASAADGRRLRTIAEGGGTVYVMGDSAGSVEWSRRDRDDAVGGQALVRLAPAVSRRPGWRAKRSFDFCAALIGIVLLSPVFLLAAIGTKLSSRGPVLFRQPRVGRDGEIFTMYKFRTFPVEHVDDKFSREHDECPIAFGRILRRTSIDELPQLFNVVRGEMSIVGPRPERPHFADPLATVVREYPFRHRVPGGITGAAQVEGFWGNSCIDTRVQLDNRYIDDWSFWSDFGILARTAPTIVRKSRS